MGKSIKIGNKIFEFKKDATSYYKRILNSYTFGESLNDDDFSDIIDLLNYDYSFYHKEYAEEIQSETKDDLSEEETLIEDIKIAQVQYGTKCFEVIWSNSESQYISYRLIINRYKENPLTTFITVCRNTIQQDLRLVKQAFFDKNSIKGFVQCQETGINSSWNELTVDHRQPNTFSVIVDRFIEINKININEIEYLLGEDNILSLGNKLLAEKFRNYHKDKAVLRIVRKECNLSRTSMAKISPQKKDLKIE